MTDKKLIIRIVGGVMLATVLLLGVQAWLDTRKQFHSPTWRAAMGDGGPERRCEMVQDLMDNHIQTGMAYDDIQTLLGPVTLFEDPTMLVYDLGTCDSLFPLDPYYFVVRFNDGLVTRTGTTESY